MTGSVAFTCRFHGKGGMNGSFVLGDTGAGAVTATTTTTKATSGYGY